jgi:tetratricopeptide (TPR) repeat protein
MKHGSALWTAFTAMSLALAGCSDKHQPDEADVSYGEARKAYDAGDHASALDLVTKAIQAKPTGWAYALRGRIYAERKEFGKAQEDASKGLALEPANRDLIWLDTELKKPAGQRFQGANKRSPGDTK